MNKNFLSKEQCESIINYALKLGIDYVQIYNSSKIKKYTILTEEISEKTFIENGISIDFFINDKYYNISTTNFNVNFIKKLIKEKITKKLKPKSYKELNSIIEEKEDLLDDFEFNKIKEERDAYCTLKKDILSLKITLLSEKNIAIIANSKGNYLKKIEYHYKIDVLMQAKIAEKIHFNYYNNGVSSKINSLKGLNLKQELDKLYNKLKKIKDKSMPFTHMPVVLASGIGGLIMHEACGHSLESREILANKSVLNNVKEIQNKNLNLVDNPTIDSLFGSYKFDDEGNKSERKVLISNGKIENYLLDNYGSLKLNKKNNSSGRKEGYYNTISSRMSNTYIENGNCSLGEIISSIKKGIYIKNIAGGIVDTISGNFSFNAVEAYLINSGKIDFELCLDNLTVIGNTIDLLNNISMIGNDLGFNCGICGSESGLIYTTVGQPTIKVESLFVGDF